MNRKDNLRARKTKRKILNAFIELRSECPDRKIKVTDLCKKSGIVRSSFYHYFKTPDDLYAEMMYALKEALTTCTCQTSEEAIRNLVCAVKENSALYCTLYTHSEETMRNVQDKIITPYLEQHLHTTDTSSMENRFCFCGVAGLLYEWLTSKEACSSEVLIDWLTTRLCTSL